MDYPTLNSNLNTLRLSDISGGIVIDSQENEIENQQSPNMLNMIFDGRILKKREGQKVLFHFGEGQLYSCYEKAFYHYILYHVDQEIAAVHLETKTKTTLIRHVKENSGKFFSYNGSIYYLGTGEYYKISYDQDREALNTEIVSGYIPTVLINCDSTGVGDSNEPYNFLTMGFKASYNTTVSMTQLKIPGAPLDSLKSIEITLDGESLSKSFYSVNYTTGVVTFSKTFSSGHNNLVVTAYSVSEEEKDRDKITYCNLVEFFGGSSSGVHDGTRIFVAGNEKYANTFYRSYLKNPEYFPVEEFDILGDTLDPITGFGKQYNTLVIFKESSIYLSRYVYESGEVIFTVSQLHSTIGCDVKNSICVVNNQLTFIHSDYGVLSLFSTSILEEKNIKVISNNINGIYSKIGLLKQSDIKNAVAFIYKERYYVVTQDYCYVLNFKNNFYWGMKSENMSWYLFNHITAVCTISIDGQVYLGGGGERFTYFDNVLYDFDIRTPIYSYFQTKAFDFQMPGIFKRILDVSLLLRADKNSYLKLSFFDEDGPLNKSYEYSLNKFSFVNFSFLKFTFYDNQFAVFLRRRIFRKRVKFFSILLENNKNNSDMAVNGMSINYNIERGARFNGY